MMGRELKFTLKALAGGWPGLLLLGLVAWVAYTWEAR